MSFEDLPRDWAQRPLTDPDIFEDVVDLVTREKSRVAGAIMLLLCHPDGRLLQPIAIEDDTGPVALEVVDDGLRALLSGLVQHGMEHVVIVIARPGGVAVTEQDRHLKAVFEAACCAAGMELLGLAVAAPEGVVALPTDRSSDAA